MKGGNIPTFLGRLGEGYSKIGYFDVGKRVCIDEVDSRRIKEHQSGMPDIREHARLLIWNDRSCNKTSESSLPIACLAPPVKIKLYVGRIPKYFDEDAVKSIFQPSSVVVDVIMIREKTTGEKKGCAFVTVHSITDADRAIRELNNTKILEPNVGPIQVKYAVGEADRLGLPSASGAGGATAGIDQAKLFVGSLPKGCTTENVCDIFKNYGNVEEVFLMKDEEKTLRGRKSRNGCAFVRFAFKEEALHAIRNLNGVFTMPGGSRPMEVRFAESKKPVIEPQHVEQFSSRDDDSNGDNVCSATPFWTEYFTHDGRSYYYNEVTKQSQWERPFELTNSKLYISNISPKQLAQAECFGVQSSGSGGSAHDPSVAFVGRATYVDAFESQIHGPQGANIFIFHIPNEWTEHDLLQQFQVYGLVVSARLACDRDTGRNRGFGFVSYADISSAVAAVTAMNRYQIGGKRLKVQIKKGEEQFAHNYMSASCFRNFIK